MTRGKLAGFVHLRYLLPGIAILVASAASPLSAYTSESKEVKEILGRASAFLETVGSVRHGDGERALYALALYKAGAKPSHPKVAEGIQAAVSLGRKLRGSDGVGRAFGTDSYGPAICCILLTDIDAEKYRPEIIAYVNAFVQLQRPNGSWTYNPPTYSDTSQTQYGILCLWAAFQNGIQVPVESVEQTAIWLMSTQHRDGGWSYRPPSGNGEPSVSMQVHVQATHSMSAAGLGSIYVCSHLLGFSAQDEQTEEDGVPSALVKVERKDLPGKHLKPQRVSASGLMNSARSGNGWFAGNLTYETKWWTHYYMYAVERYKSLQALVEGKKDDEAQWYDDGVRFLKETQAADGSWRTQSATSSSRSIDTAFAMLFLSRSTQKTIGKVLDEGILIGGRGLPKDLTNLKMQDGQVVTPQAIQDVDDLLDLLKDVEDKPFDATALPMGLPLDQDLTKRNSQLEKLREAVSHEDFNVRRAAVQTLACVQELDNAPGLIFALSDPDPRIAKTARDGLRFISRKFWGYGLGEGASEQEIQQAQQQWKDWYRSIRPDGELIE